MMELFPTGSHIESGVLHLDSLAATELAERFGTPLVVYSEGALRERARMFRRAVPERSSSTGRRRSRTSP